MKGKFIISALCMLSCGIISQAQQGEPVRNLVVTLKSGETIEYRTDLVEKVSFDDTPQESGLITVDEIGDTFFRFSIHANGEPYIFAAFETGYLYQYDGEENMLGLFGHYGYEDASYDWEDGMFFEFEDITVTPGHNYTILAAIYPGEGQKPDRIERVDLTTVAEEQSQASVDITLVDITNSSVTIKAVPTDDVKSYVVFVKDKAWVDNVITTYGEATLQSTTERAAELGMAESYVAASEEVWYDLQDGTEYSCIVVIEDIEGKKKTDIHNFTTLE